MPLEVLKTSSAKPIRWNRLIALTSSQVSSFAQTIHAWMASAMSSSRS
jgi:hypothetical protein